MRTQQYPFSLFILFLLIGVQLGAQNLEHHLKRGETLYGLSRKYGVSVDAIMSANGITNPESLVDGVVLVIPGQTEGGVKAEKPAGALYTVEKGDTFYRIAKKHGLSVSQLMALNDFKGNQILKAGDTLIVAGTPRKNLASKPGGTGVPFSSDSSGGYGRQDVWPVKGRKESLEGKLGGVKIEAPEASLVKSIASGNVVWTGPYRGFGKVVLIDVDGYIYLYGGNDDVFVNVGEYVSAGSRIGRLGHSGIASRTVDMYFSVFKDGIPVSVVSAPRG